MPRLTRANYDAIRDHLFDCIHRHGERVKNEFPNTLRTAIAGEVWKHFRGVNGEEFKNLVEWLQYTFPNGAGMGQGQHAITYEEALKLTEGASDVHRVLAENAPKNKGGRPSKNGKGNQGADTQVSLERGNTRNKTAAVLSVRLAQEKPKFYEAYLRGKYTSVTQAATEAGLLKDNAQLRRAKAAYRNMPPEQRKEFLEWLKTLG